MKSIESNIRKGDTVMFLGVDRPVFDINGNQLFVGLTPGNNYTVKQSFIVGLSLEEVEGMFLKEHFRKV